MDSELTFKIKKVLNFIIPAVARILITSAFIQDSIDTIHNLEFPDRFNIVKYVWFFYQCNIIFSSLICSLLIIFNKLIAPCTACLTGFSFVSLFAYHNFTDSILITRRVSVLGGLFLLMAKGMESKKDQFKIGLPEVPMISKSTYLELVGRIMITFLFFTQIISLGSAQSLFAKVILILVGAVAFAMIGVGYKVRYVCSCLCVVVFLVNIGMNPYWKIINNIDMKRDMRFEFFQMLAISGSLLLLANNGAGELSVDQKKKNF